MTEDARIEEAAEAIRMGDLLTEQDRLDAALGRVDSWDSQG
jgi:hypothetical protein